ncbi:HlyD family secretion protein [Chloroflexota bacterium]
MKRCGIIGILLLGMLLITVTSCGRDDKETATQPPPEGDINVTITADGNMEASFQMGLTFGSGGKVDQIFVNKGDKVTEGDVLAKLDIAQLEMSLTQAQVTQAQTQITQAQAQVAVTQAWAVLAQAQAARNQAEIAKNTAEDNLEDTYNHLRWARRTYNRFDAALKEAEIQYETAQLEFQVARSQLEAAELQIEAVVSQVEITGLQLEVAELQLEITEQAIEEAQKQLDEATIIAPFDGIVYKVGAKEGEFISHAAFTERNIVEIIDLRHMELVTSVDEPDIAKVKIGQKVMISVNALPGTMLEGRVTFISPVARKPVGVVLFEDEDEEKNYEVKIDFAVPENLPIRAGMSATAEIIVE